MKFSSPTLRLGKTILFMLLLIFFSFYLVHRLLGLSPNTMQVSGTIVAFLAAILTALHTVSPKIANKLDNVLQLTGFRDQGVRVIAAIVAIIAFILAGLASLGFLRIIGPGVADRFIGIIVVISLVAVGLSVILLENYRPAEELFNALFNSQSSEKMRKRLGPFAPMALFAFRVPFYIIAFLLVVRLLADLPFLLVQLGIAVACYYIVLNLLRVFLSPVEMSEQIQQISGGRSITLAMALLLICVAFALYLVGLLMRP